jgi:hypothetical protein
MIPNLWQIVVTGRYLGCKNRFGHGLKPAMARNFGRLQP